MKAHLAFNDGFEFRCAVNGRRLMSLLWDLQQEMRQCTKYDGAPCEPGSPMNYTRRDTTRYWGKRLYCLAEEHRIDLEDDYEG